LDQSATALSYLQRLVGGAGYGSTQTTTGTPFQTNPFLSGTSGALTGAQLYNTFRPQQQQTFNYATAPSQNYGGFTYTDPNDAYNAQMLGIYNGG
jgi:hypothetical protein